MTYSDYIYRLRDLLEQLGCTIQLYRYDLPAAGQCCYQTQTICLNEPAAQKALLTLAHEGGHWWSYLLWPNLDFNRQQREQLAFLLGWWLLWAVDAEIPVDDWYEDHQELF